MKNLMLKILRGSPPPLSNLYTYDLRHLVAALLRKDPKARPSLTSIFRRGFIRKAEESLNMGRPVRAVTDIRQVPFLNNYLAFHIF